MTTTNEGAVVASLPEDDPKPDAAPPEKKDSAAAGGPPVSRGLEIASLLMPALAMVGAQMDSQKREMEKLASDQKRRCARRRGRHFKIREKITEVRWVRYEIGPILAATVIATVAFVAAVLSKAIG